MNTQAEKTAEFIKAVLNAEELIINYDEAFAALSDDEITPFDLLPRLCYHFSEAIETLAQYENAKRYVSELAVDCLHFNMYEGDNAMPELID